MLLPDELAEPLRAQSRFTGGVFCAARRVCHAGLGAGVAARFKTLAEINSVIRDELAKGDEDGLAASATGPLWIRSIAESVNSPNDGDAVILPALKKFAAARMVVGHSIMDNRITVGLNDRLILIDVGMTGYYGGPAACLIIEKGEFFAVHDGQKKQKLFSAPAAAPAASQPEELKPAA